ncbi:MAG: response regulator transcription factor [Maricaulaceae bacterium]|nr:response regulator transcription factor [Maricaulaceae bacterium]
MTGDLRILLIEDEDVWAGRVAAALAAEPGWRLQRAADAATALRLGGAGGFDVLIVDRILEADGAEGLDILARLRAAGVTAPALVLSGLGQARHRVEGLDAGADDYLPKPFDKDELRARIRSLIRRSGAAANPEVYVIGGLEVRAKARTAHWNGTHIRLSPQEFDILKTLAGNAGEPVSRETLWRVVWTDFPNLPPQINVIDVAVARLRRALRKTVGHDLIATRRLQGFVLTAAGGEDGQDEG